MGGAGLAWQWELLATILPLVVVVVTVPARRHNPGHYLRLFDLPELCPHLSFVVPWGPDRREEEVVLLQQGHLSLRQLQLVNSQR